MREREPTLHAAIAAAVRAARLAGEPRLVWSDDGEGFRVTADENDAVMFFAPDDPLAYVHPDGEVES